MAFHPTDGQRACLEAVDSAWYELTKGELLIGGDGGDHELERLVLYLWASSEDYVHSVDAAQVACRTGEEIIGAVDEADEIPARVARALSILWYGQ